MTTESILEEVMKFYDIDGKELFSINDITDNKLMNIKKVTATLIKEVGRLPIKEISNLFGESVIETRKKYIQGIDRKVLYDLSKLSNILRKKHAIKNNFIKRKSAKYK